MAVTIRTQADGSLLLAVKVVPGASRARVVGPLGEALKVAVAAPPEAGKANRAVCELLADALGLAASCVSIHVGGGSPRKQVRIAGLSADDCRRRLGLEC